MSTEFAVSRRRDHTDALASLAAYLGCTIREAERRLTDGAAAGEIRRAQPPRRGIDGHLAYARRAGGAVVKVRYALPAMIAWCWPLVMGAENSRVTSTLSWLLPFGAPLIGALLAEFDNPTAVQA